MQSKVGGYTIVAKRKGDKWFIGGFTNDGERSREFDIPLNFLEPDKMYRMTSFEDGPNAASQAMDYNKNTSQVAAGTMLHIKVVRNGGFAAVLE